MDWDSHLEKRKDRKKKEIQRDCLHLWTRDYPPYHPVKESVPRKNKTQQGGKIREGSMAN